MIELEKVFFWYAGREKAALADVTLQIPDGQSVEIHRKQRLGGLLNHYYRQAA